MYDSVLLPTDGSESMAEVVEHATAFVDGRDATVHVLYVVDDRAFLTLDDGLQEDVLADLQATGEVAITRVADQLSAAGVNTETEIRRGNPADEILAYRDDHDLDAIVMGTHGEDFTNNVVGSVSRAVVARARVPVMTINVSEPPVED
jgi:nucleotide-binding universal stress UspA family protein